MQHPWLVVMTNVCDLMWDFDQRQGVPDEERAQEDWEHSYQRIIPHILTCSAYEESEIKGLHDLNTKRLKRVRKNQEERLHYLLATASNADLLSVPALYLDFKKAFSLPTESIYDGLAGGSIQRVAVVRGEYLYDLMHRFYSFLGRVGVPEAANETTG